MLKRQQVLLADWQIDYAKFITEKYDMSFSEAIRILICMGVLQIAKEFSPEFKSGISAKNAASSLKKMQEGRKKVEVYHQMLSKLYFESRKAAEVRKHRLKKEI